MSEEEFTIILQDREKIQSLMTKYEICLCLNSVESSLVKENTKYCKSWKKGKLAEYLHTVTIETPSALLNSSGKMFKNPKRLVSLCKRALNNIPKYILNSIVAENEMVPKIKQWRENSTFATETKVGIDEKSLTWFSFPEYNPETLSYIFAYLDVHHLITNCRVKICKDGIPERGIKRKAWVEVARSNKTSLKIAHVEDLIDKQSDAIARATFSKEVQDAMSQKYPEEAVLCSLIREFYEAEDDPGLDAEERFRRRMAFREWLLDGVNFCKFPPYGSHIRGIPNIMFQGFLTNIDRRIQLYPFVKSGSYCLRTCGSLEAGNLFGQFQDLDPKGSGVMKSEDVPTALEHACQLLQTALSPNRSFHMKLSKAKVYPVNALSDCDIVCPQPCIYVYPTYISRIVLRNHVFDAKARGKRKARRRLVAIKGPNEAARGVTGVRQHHKTDEGKMLADRRANILLDIVEE